MYGANQYPPTHQTPTNGKPYEEPYSSVVSGGLGGNSGFNFGGSNNNPDNLLWKEMDSADVRRDLYHMLRRDRLTYRGEKPIWDPNPHPPGSPHGPLANEAGISEIIRKVTPFLAVFPAVAVLSAEEIDRQLLQFANDTDVWFLDVFEEFQINERDFPEIHRILLNFAKWNLSRAENGYESKRQTFMYTLREQSYPGNMSPGSLPPSMQGPAKNSPGFWSRFAHAFGGRKI
jgi:hypothetical protein